MNWLGGYPVQAYNALAQPMPQRVYPTPPWTWQGDEQIFRAPTDPAARGGLGFDNNSGVTHPLYQQWWNEMQGRASQRFPR